MTREPSKAFERLVNADDPDRDDLVGMLAYATYKRDKRDFALSGERTSEQLSNHHNMLTPGLIDQYRTNALHRLEAYAGAVVDAAEPEISERTRVEAITAAKSEIIDSLKQRTSPLTSILFNVLAWLISLAITFLVAISLGKISVNIVAG